MTRMTDEDVGRLLRELPRSEASSEFTDQVLRKLDRSRARRRGKWPTRFAVAATVVLGAALVSGFLRQRFEESRAAARVQALRDEYRELQVELEKLRSLAQEVEPILDLGGTDQVDFIFDLRELAREGDEGPKAEPASHPQR